MTNQVQAIALSKLVEHPDNPNRMSAATFAKLVRNIRRTGRYEPLVVRPCPGREGMFQIINGHHRFRALQELGRVKADVVVWDMDDAQTEILLATLNRLGGVDVLDKKLALLRKLRQRTKPGELAKLLPQTAKQIERLTSLNLPRHPAAIGATPLAHSLVFFVSERQKKAIDRALSVAEVKRKGTPKAARRAAALTTIAERYIQRTRRT